MSEVKTLKKFTSLERLVLYKLVKLIEDGNYTQITATKEDLETDIPKRLITRSQRDKDYLSQLDIQYLVYLITSDKAELRLRVSCLKVVFYKLNLGEDYPYMDLLTKAEFIEDAFIPEIKTVLLALHFQLGENNEQNSKHIRREPSENDVNEVEAKDEKLRRGNNGIVKPSIF